jgi:hypothetical protein
MGWNPSLPDTGFDPRSADELVGRLHLAASRLETALSVRSSRARIAGEAWTGRRRAEVDGELETLTRLTATLLDEVRAAMIRVLGASDDAEAARRYQARAEESRLS